MGDNPFVPSGGGSSSSGGSSGGSSSSSSDSSSSSSSSAPAAPPVDPRVAQLESLFRSLYIQLWGEPPTEAYVKAAANQGMNTTEFADRERMKESFKSTKTYQDTFKSVLSTFRQMGAI